MESKFNFQLSQKAENDLNDIIRYLAVDLANPKAASTFLEKFQSAVDEVRLFPQSGSPVPNDFLNGINIRKVLIGNFIMYYLPDDTEQTIFVVRIVYGRRNLEEILQDLNF